MGYLVAQVAVATGIPPGALIEDGQMLQTLVKVLNDNAKARR